MFVAELFENPQRNLIVIYPGRFQPFHKGHKAVYDYLVKKYGRDHVYIATSNKTDNLKSPFSFSDKAQFMAATGVSLDRVIESTQPYQVPELKSQINLSTTVMIYAVSEKDMAEDPRFASWTKKDGSPSHFQPLPASLTDTVTVDQHSYIEVVPTFDFRVGGQVMRSASEIRALYKSSDDTEKKQIIVDLFGTFTPELKHIMDAKLGALEEGKIGKALGTAALAAGIGLGGPAQANDNTITNVLGAGVVGLRTAKNIQGMSKAGVQDELNQELRAIIRGNKKLPGTTINNPTQPSVDINNDTPEAEEERRKIRDRMMRGENVTESAGVGTIIDLSSNWGNYQQLHGQIESISPKGQLKIKIVSAVPVSGKTVKLKVGDQVALAQHFIKRAPIVKETIRKVNGVYRLLSRKGKNLGTYPTKAGAEKRERQVQYFKHMGEGDVLNFPGQTPPPNFKNAVELAKATLDIIKNPDIENFEEMIAHYRGGLKKLGYYLRFTHEGAYLVNPQFNHKTLIDTLKNISEDASGYIPKNKKEAKDPRWSNALTVDVRPDTMKKEIAKFFPTKALDKRQHHVTETTVQHDKQDSSILHIQPKGGMGTWDIASLKSSLHAQFLQLADMIKSNPEGAEHLIYRAGAIKSKLQALVQTEQYLKKIGRKRVAKGKTINLGNVDENHSN
jgi:hypothetical protein